MFVAFIGGILDMVKDCVVVVSLYLKNAVAVAVALLTGTTVSIKGEMVIKKLPCG